MKSGDAFMADLGYGDHPHVVLSNPFGGDNHVIVAMISTYDADYKNPTCALYPSDGHSAITHTSSVAYHLARSYRVAELEKLIRRNMEPFSDAVMQRILKGATSNSSDFPNKYWVELDRQKLIPQ